MLSQLSVKKKKKINTGNTLKRVVNVLLVTKQIFWSNPLDIGQSVMWPVTSNEFDPRCLFEVFLVTLRN